MASPRRRSNAVSTIYVHGTGTYADEKWKPQWDLALFGRPMGQRTTGVDWASKRRRSGKTDDLSILDEAGIDPYDSKAAAFAEQLNLSLNLDVDNSSIESNRQRRFSLPEGWRGKSQQKILRAHVTGAVSYFFNPDFRRRAIRRLRKAINSQPSRLVLVAHGFGTIIAYEVLTKMDPEDLENVRMFVTLGSSLGAPEIQEQLGYEGDRSLPFPDGLREWQNFADQSDIIAMDSWLENDFASRDESVVIQDHFISNRNLWFPNSWTPHNSSGYLSHPDVRNMVHQAVGFDSADRFVVARDVAFSLSAQDVRQPVLIEALEINYNAVEEGEDECEERERDQDDDQKTINGRIERLADEVCRIVRRLADDADSALRDARVQRLRKYVSAHLTPSEIQELAANHAEFNIYAMWRSSKKKTLLHRSHRAIGADAARSGFKSLGNGITWAVLDTGCRMDHPHFHQTKGGHRVRRSLIVNVYDCESLPGDADSLDPQVITETNDWDPNGHGTHVCGIITGQGKERGRNYSGVAPETKLLVYKVLNEYGEGEDAWIIKALDDIFRRNENNSSLAVHGVNLSLGGAFDPTVYGCGFSPICQMIRDLWRQGVLVCVAAGNEGQIKVSTADGPFDLNTSHSIGDPANQDDCIAVGSANTDKPHLYGVSYFSSRGPTADGRGKPDVVAPGERINSCNNDVETKKYRQSSGTSMACPHVSGLLAAFLSVRREFIGRPDEVKQIMLENCNDLKRHQHHQGHGIPNLLKMLTNT